MPPKKEKEERRKLLDDEDELTLPPGISVETATWMRIQARTARVMAVVGDSLDGVETRLDRVEAAILPGVAAATRVLESAACLVEEITRAFRAIVALPVTLFKLATRENPVAQTGVVLGGFILGAAVLGIEVAQIDVNALFRDVLRPCECENTTDEEGDAALLPAAPDEPQDTINPLQ